MYSVKEVKAVKELKAFLETMLRVGNDPDLENEHKHNQALIVGRKCETVGAMLVSKNFEKDLKK